jgi:hypothetical protein
MEYSVVIHPMARPLVVDMFYDVKCTSLLRHIVTKGLIDSVFVTSLSDISSYLRLLAFGSLYHKTYMVIINFVVLCDLYLCLSHNSTQSLYLRSRQRDYPKSAVLG